MSSPIRVGLIGSGFISAIHLESLRACPAEVVGVASPSGAERFAAKHGIPRHFSDYRRLLEMRELDMVVIGAPNALHCQMTIDAAGAGSTWFARSLCV